MEIEKIYYTTSEATKLTEMKPLALTRLARKMGVRKTRNGGKYMFTKEDIEAILDHRFDSEIETMLRVTI